MRFSIICSANKPDVLNSNLLKSPGILEHEIITIFGSKNVPTAYNKGVSIASEEILIFVHQDVFLPETFFSDLKNSITKLESENWGVLGPIGVDLYNNHVRYLGNILDRGNPLGEKENLPLEIETLDEMMLIMRKSDAQFDENIPTTHHMHGPDICMRAFSLGKKNFAIDSFCHHNSTNGYDLPPEFYTACEYVKEKWEIYLPIVTTCTVLQK
jgi:hypothetical protein